ncbi:MAG: polysaccharide deacetylase [Bryobacteraceae bacterium]|nr:MAG: polysaccharide deacetylase [Bryobacteraceae bacterium]
MTNILTIDVEDYFHPTEVQRTVDPARWDSFPSRVEEATAIVLDLLDAAGVRATFFILGWVAARRPALVRRIAEAGHELGCHSFAHALVFSLTPQQFRRDTEMAVDAIAQAAGIRPRAYRAPSFSITARSFWALEVLAECGIQTDSSIYPVRHDRYGVPDHPFFPHRLQTPSGTILEVPPAAVPLHAGRNAPAGGGAYLRLLPYSYVASSIRLLNHVHRAPACLYLHPWEFDTAQPRLASGLLARLRTYLGLRTMGPKLARLMSEFPFGPLGEVCPPQGAYPLLPARAGRP